MSKYSQLVSIPFDRRKVNGSLSPARNASNTALIGSPRGTYDSTCQEATDHALIERLGKFSFAGIPAWGLKPFAEVLTRIDAEIRQKHPDLYQHLGYKEVLCCRLVRGSNCSISNHSWGIAIDLTFDEISNIRGGNLVQVGLLRIAPIFKAHRLFWGIGFPVQDAMHFEASEQLIKGWAKDGQIRSSSAPINRALQFGDRCSLVEDLQKALNQLLHPSVIDEDGIFGPDTRNAVIEAHMRLDMPPKPHASIAFLKKLTA